MAVKYVFCTAKIMTRQNLLAHFNPDPTIFQIRGRSALYVLQMILLVIQVTETYTSVLNIEPP